MIYIYQTLERKWLQKKLLKRKGTRVPRYKLDKHEEDKALLEAVELNPTFSTRVPALEPSESIDSSQNSYG